MGGGALQLSLTGTQDQYLTDVPDITFFKTLYKKHTQFAVESAPVTFQGVADFGKKCVAIIPNTGDLLSKVWLQITLPDLTQYVPAPLTATHVAWVNNIGLALLSSIEFTIGGSRIDKHYPEFMDIMMQLTEPVEKRKAMNEMLGRYDDWDNTDPKKSFAGSRILYVPLQFAFCKDYVSALPLVALTLHPVSLNFEFSSLLSCVRSSGAPLTGLFGSGYSVPSMSVQLWVDYMFLGTKERLAFASQPHEYLIETLQFTGDAPLTAPTSLAGTLYRKFPIFFNNPVKELLWVYVSATNSLTDTLFGNDRFNYRNPGSASFDCFDSCQLIFNGAERFGTRPGSYFRLVQPYCLHRRVPDDKPVYMYSFGLAPDELQPSGEANMSRFTTVELALSLNAGLANGAVKVFGRTYNVLRIMNGQGSLAFTT